MILKKKLLYSCFSYAMVNIKAEVLFFIRDWMQSDLYASLTFRVLILIHVLFFLHRQWHVSGYLSESEYSLTSCFLTLEIQ